MQNGFTRYDSLVTRLMTFVLLCLLCSCVREDTQMFQRPEYIPEFYTSEPVHGTVVDADTNEPVEGAVVVAIWREVGAFVNQWAGIYRFRETTTDAGGRFTIPRWGPRPSRHGMPGTYLDKRHPELWIIKTGYLVTFADNATPQSVVVTACDPNRPFVTLPPNKISRMRGEYARGPLGGSIWNGKTIAVRRAKSPQELACSLGVANPDDPHPAVPLRLPLFEEEWKRAFASLPPDVAATVSQPPRSLVDFDPRE